MKKISLLIVICLIKILDINYLYASSIIFGDQNKISISNMVEKVLPSVVNIYVEGSKKSKNFIPKEFKHFFEPELFNRNNNKYKQFEGLGSGVIINSKKGYIVTNNHVVNGANLIKVQLYDGREFNAKLIGCDEQTDLALLRIFSFNDLVEIKIADSDNIRIGDFVIAIGNPFGLGQTVTSGIISALGRSGLNIDGLENFIQTDASINKGNSGGPLINLNGELIGINTAILAPNGGNIGIGFAIPSNIVTNLSKQIINYGEVKRGQLGIRGTELNFDIAQALNINIRQGAFVNEVITGSAADKSGIKAGDIIISINNKPIKSFSELRVKIGITSPGETIKLGILRNNKIKFFSVILDSSISSVSGKNILYPLLKGAKFKNYKSSNGLVGIIVENVTDDSPASYIGLKKDDIIIGINKDKVYNINQFKKVLESKNSSVIALNIVRGENKIFILLK
ncbi:serine endoprotease [endosymbiont of Sipalinus gigas]|uniref:Do family serine endopeptidase n=1 Tax=endosymbiont of Sipalinus gigas TaxID=1972134 RepID=UPI000DC6E4F8|nr:Do family serine endopeptidase [endosymbiont of Sipalinus gigas]BBA85306.1 serine endoprotease [endosymbiont of Sipalinus gigas]